MAQNRKFSIIRAVELSLQSLLLLILIAQLILLKCVISYGYIPLPAKRINSYLATHSIQELRLAASSYKLRLNGQIEAFGLQLFRANNKKPILFADNARLDWRIQTKENLDFNSQALCCPEVYFISLQSIHRTARTLAFSRS